MTENKKRESDRQKEVVTEIAELSRKYHLFDEYGSSELENLAKWAFSLPPSLQCGALFAILKILRGKLDKAKDDLKIVIWSYLYDRGETLEPEETGRLLEILPEDA